MNMELLKTLTLCLAWALGFAELLVACWLALVWILPGG